MIELTIHFIIRFIYIYLFLFIFMFCGSCSFYLPVLVVSSSVLFQSACHAHCHLSLCLQVSPLTHRPCFVYSVCSPPHILKFFFCRYVLPQQLLFCLIKIFVISSSASCQFCSNPPTVTAARAGELKSTQVWHGETST